MALKIMLALAGVVLIALGAQRYFASFMAQSPTAYAGTKPAFDPRVHLAGPMVSEGVIFGPTGHVSSRFVADMNGTWSNSGGILSEVFSFDESGEPLRREWNITDTGPNQFVATASDVVGEAVGVYEGSALQMKYRLRLSESAGGHVLNVTDWLYLAPNGHILNKSEMRKFGIKVAELVATIRPGAPNFSPAE